ncbi:MAG TPA: ABC transporter permease, partial [Vicinamibacterales bacterium]|nr:ABC transporter permease [Vicinamibacterales bacterium]
MTLWAWIGRRARLVFARRNAESQVDDELRFHLELEIAERVRAGMAPDEARRTALRDFGRVEVIKDAWRDRRPLAWLDGLRRDVTFAWRGIRRSPGFSFSVVLVSALGIGATTAMFGVVNGVLLQPLPLPEAHRLYSLQLHDESGNAYGVSAESFRVVETGPGIERAGRYSVGSVVLTTADEPERLRTELVTSDLFTVLGVQPAIGRGFTLAEERSGASIVLSHELWMRRFAGDSGIVGRAISIDGASAVVVGVMPAGFTGARPWLLAAPAVWMPLDRSRASRAAGLVLRIRRDVRGETVEAWLDGVLRLRMPNITGTDSVNVRPDLDSLQEITVGSLRKPLAVLFGSVCFVLLLVAVNVATLLLARGAARDRELAVRRALGASRWRQIRHVLLESLMLTGAGGVLGAILAVWGTAVVRALGADVLPRLSAIGVDWNVLVFAALLAVGCGLGVGLVPALVYGGGNGPGLLASLSGAGRVEQRTTRWGGVRGALVVTEIALSFVLLVGAGLMLKGFLRLMPADAGF